MSDSDNDFDGVEAGLTTVLLGFAEREATQSDLSVHGNHVGGPPVWFEDSAPPQALLNCKVCDKKLELLAQLSCPLPDKYYDRVLYILTCTDPSCRRKEGSVRAIRGIESNEKVRQRIAKEIEESKPENSLVPEQPKIGDSLFATASSTQISSNPFEDANMALQPKPEPSVSNNSNNILHSSKRNVRIAKGEFICKSLTVEDEYLELPDPEKQLKGIKIEYTEPDSEAGEGDGNGAGKASESLSAKELETRSDPAFAHFVDIVESNPEQVLRYERGLKPLLYSEKDGVSQKLKELNSKILELQLMPHLIAEVETQDMILEGMEWGSIFVATDKQDSLPQLNDKGIGYVEEWVAVQWE